MRRCKLNWGWLFTGLLFGIVLMGLTGQADDLEDALKSAPQGVKLENIFQVGTTPAGSSKASSASVVATKNPDAPDTDAVKITDNTNQIGYIWSTEQNKFNLNEDAKSSMWMYFGNQGSAAADGMAFVLQNDPQGYAARPKFAGETIFGETLGVWGVDNDKARQNPSDIAKTAIQNSWALGFDTHHNASDSYDQAGVGDSFDLGLNGQNHLSANYPGEAGSYTQHKQNGGILGWRTNYFFSLNQPDPLYIPSLSDGHWHHLTLEWHAQSHQMTYQFDDKNLDGTVNSKAVQKSFNIDPAKFNSPSGKVLWGFTGATGNNFETNMVIFESVQGIVDAKATATIQNLTQNKAVNTGDTVESGDKLSYQYHLKYENGKQAWDKVVADIQLPVAVKFSKASLKYADGTSETVSLNAGTDFKHQLTKALSTANKTADLELVGTAETVDHDTKVDGAKGTFHANNFVTTATAPDFTIKKRAVDLQLSFPNAAMTIKKGQAADVQAKLVAKVGDFTNSKVKLQPTLNGTDLPSFTLKDSDDHGAVKFIIAANDLKVGANQLTLVATDQADNRSNVAKLAIKVLSGELKFGKVADQSHFADTTVTGKSQLVLPQNDWTLQVIDERGKDSRWQLMAQATPFKTDSGQVAHGGVVYRDGDTTKRLTDQNSLIQTHQTKEDTEEYDVTSQWSSTQGIQYQVNAGDQVGQYQGKITWSLVDAPN